MTTQWDDYAAQRPPCELTDEQQQGAMAEVFDIAVQYDYQESNSWRDEELLKLAIRALKAERL